MIRIYTVYKRVDIWFHTVFKRINLCTKRYMYKLISSFGQDFFNTTSIAQLVESLLSEREVVGWNPTAIPKVKNGTSSSLQAP